MRPQSGKLENKVRPETAECWTDADDDEGRLELTGLTSRNERLYERMVGEVLPVCAERVGAGLVGRVQGSSGRLTQ